jgi:actin-related protein
VCVCTRGIVDLIFSALEAADPEKGFELKKQLVSNVVLAGGSTM